MEKLAQTSCKSWNGQGKRSFNNLNFCRSGKQTSKVFGLRFHSCHSYEIAVLVCSNSFPLSQRDNTFVRIYILEIQHDAWESWIPKETCFQNHGCFCQTLLRSAERYPAEKYCPMVQMKKRSCRLHCNRWSKNLFDDLEIREKVYSSSFQGEIVECWRGALVRVLI